MTYNKQALSLQGASIFAITFLYLISLILLINFIETISNSKISNLVYLGFYIPGLFTILKGTLNQKATLSEFDFLYNDQLIRDFSTIFAGVFLLIMPTILNT